jgi:Fe-S cluster assembly protein SufD
MTLGGNERELYLSHFRDFEERLGGDRNEPLHRVRREAIERFAERGFPTTREEDWRFTNLAPLAKVPFRLPRRFTVEGAIPERLALEAPEDGGARLVFVNGRFAPALSRVDSLPGGVLVQSLAEAIERDAGAIEPYLAGSASRDDSPFVALNTAFLEDGAFIRVPDGVVVRAPIRLVFLSTPNGEPTVAHPRSLIIAGKGSQVSVVETYGATGSGVTFTNAVTQVTLDGGAAVDHYKLELEDERAFHVGSVAATQGRASQFSSHSISIGGALVRNDLVVRLESEGGECALSGLYVVRGAQHVDNRTVIDHASPRCTSRENYKGVLDGKSRAVFNGEIIVREDAQKTDARQMNKNLILSEDALVNTKPRLRILADDVKCTHGATVGMLDEDALFYLRSRAIDEPVARSILTYAFVSEVLEPIGLKPLRAGIDRILRGRLPAGERIEEPA